MGVTGNVTSEVLRALGGLIQLVLGVALLSHYIACAWYAVGRLEQDKGEESWTERFLVQTGRDSDWLYAYTTALHWSLTQFTTASMEVVPQSIMERVFVCWFILGAVVVFSSIISQIQQTARRIQEVRKETRKQNQLVRWFFLVHDIPSDMTFLVQEFIKRHSLMNLQKSRISVSEVPVFSRLPAKIRDQLNEYAYAPILLKHPFFEAFRTSSKNAFRRVTCDCMEEIRLLPEEGLVWHAEINMMLFVVIGEMQYVDCDPSLPDLRVVPGEWACEEALWASSPILLGKFTAGISGCELVGVRSKDLQDCCKIHSETLDFVLPYARAFIAEFNKASQDDECQDVLFNSVETAHDIVRCAGQATGTLTLARLKRQMRYALRSGSNLRISV